MNVTFKEDYSPSDLKEAASCYGVDPEKLTFESYDHISPQDLIWFDGGMDMFNSSHGSFGWGKNLNIDELEIVLNKKYHRRNYNWFISQAPIGLNPIILINNQICDGAGRSILCHALGQQIRIARFKIKKD